MMTIGEILKSEREKRGFSLQEIGLFLKISPKILMAIEEDQKDKLPAKTFLRGFVKSYASYLKLDVDAILVQFNHQYGTSQPTPLVKKVETTEIIVNSPALEEKPEVKRKVEVTEIKFEKPDERKKNNFNMTTVIIAIAAIAVVVVGFVAEKIFHKYEKETIIKNKPATEMTQPIEVIVPATATSGSVAPTGAMTEAASGATGGVSAATPIPATPETTTAAPATAAPPQLAPLNVSTSTVEPTHTTSEPKKSEVKPEPVKTEVAKKVHQEVIIEAIKPATIEFSFDGKPSEKVTLKEGEIHTLRARTGVSVKVLDNTSVNIISNGKDMGPPGKDGAPVTLNFP